MSIDLQLWRAKVIGQWKACVLAGLSIVVTSSDGLAEPQAPDQSAVEQAVYAYIVRELGSSGTDLPIVLSTLNVTPKVTHWLQAEGADIRSVVVHNCAGAGSLFDQLIQEISEPADLTGLRSPVPLVLLTKKDIEQLFPDGDSDFDDWQLFTLRFPQTFGYNVVSRAAVDAKSERALLYLGNVCGGLCGGGGFVFVEKVDGEWTDKTCWAVIS
ncbi:MAG TPA: hypothetical protein VE046_03670 [Steroidobacteraceae bacterium]|nr:hypothetical protein [Steroidobacteraceae bacterium]